MLFPTVDCNCWSLASGGDLGIDKISFHFHYRTIRVRFWKTVTPLSFQRQCYMFKFLVPSEAHYRNVHILTCRNFEYVRVLHRISTSQTAPSHSNPKCDHNTFNSYLHYSHSQLHLGCFMLRVRNVLVNFKLSTCYFLSRSFLRVWCLYSTLC